MSRPEVSVVMPFGGQAWEAAPALDALRALDAGPGDELILADNSGLLVADPDAGTSPPILIVPASGERSPAYARNVGARRASRDWILFLDADCRPVGRLLEAYFEREIAEDVGTLVGEIVPASQERGLVSRYGAARNFLSGEAHLMHPYLPRAVAANLLVRRAAFEQVGGFYEGVRAAEDTDFSWRLQRAGWRMELCREALVEHRYRASLGQLRRQWRGYAAGRAWLSRRYEGFEPEPAVARALSRTRRRLTGGSGDRRGARGPAGTPTIDRASFVAIDALLALEELAGLALSNRPEAEGQGAGAQLVLVADRFPRRDDPLVELASTLEHARIEAVGRPEVPDLQAGRRLTIAYLEDEGAAARIASGLALVARHPVRVFADVLLRGPGDPSTWSLAPAVRRLEHQPAARLHALGGEAAQGLARRIARLARRGVE